MKNVIVIGCPGSGKSTFARRLRDITGLPLYYLDMIYHKPDKTVVSKDEFDNRLKQIIAKNEWIIDGNYGRTLALRVHSCDTVIWLDYPVEICMEGIAARHGQPREDMPWIEDEPDEEFIEFVKSFESTQKVKIEALLEDIRDKEIIVFKSRDESELYLKALIVQR